MMFYLPNMILGLSMITTSIYCPFCKEYFEGEMWEMGECPTCDEEYFWYEECALDYSDCWSCVDWNYDKLDRR
jgi:hypothetical protein